MSRQAGCLTGMILRLRDLQRRNRMFSKWWHYALALIVSLGVVGTALAGLAAALIYPNLPPLEALTDYKPKLPLRVYTADGALIGEFGEERRAFIAIEKVPTYMKQAIIAAEDERFYEHGGVDTLGVLRAAVSNLVSGGAKEGASTITMQVARETSSCPTRKRSPANCPRPCWRSRSNTA